MESQEERRRMGQLKKYGELGRKEKNGTTEKVWRARKKGEEWDQEERRRMGQLKKYGELGRKEKNGTTEKVWRARQKGEESDN